MQPQNFKAGGGGNSNLVLKTQTITDGEAKVAVSACWFRHTAVIWTKTEVKIYVNSTFCVQ